MSDRDYKASKVFLYYYEMSSEEEQRIASNLIKLVKDDFLRYEMNHSNKELVNFKVEDLEYKEVLRYVYLKLNIFLRLYPEYQETKELIKIVKRKILELKMNERKR